MKISLRQLKQIIKEELAQVDTKKAANEYDSIPLSMGESDDLKESQRGNDENSQHDNDTEPGDPYVKRLKEAILRDLNVSTRILRKR